LLVIAGRFDTTDEGIVLAGRAIELLRGLARQFPGTRDIQPAVGDGLHDLAVKHIERGEVALAIGLLREAIGLQEAVLKSDPGSKTCRTFLRNHLALLARCLANATDPEICDVRTAIDLAGRALDIDPGFDMAHLFLGMAQYRAGDLVAAEAALTRCLEIRHGNEPLAHLFRAMVRCRRDAKALAWVDFLAGFGQSIAETATDPEIIRTEAEAGQLLGIPMCLVPKASGQRPNKPADRGN
jgi:tetratricopeptide (TPR) repeat protein